MAGQLGAETEGLGQWRDPEVVAKVYRRHDT